MRYPLPPPVLEALDRLEAADFAAFAVGGCVRDDVLGIRPKEFDLCSAARPEQVRALFSDARVIDTGLKHGTVTVVLHGMPLEITTFRSDGTYSDARHPDAVRFSDTILEDLKRRDFTCNAMAYSPTRGLVDPHGGKADCLQKVIRAVGDPRKRFQEDALRILRAMRFAAVLGFQIDPATQRAMRDAAENTRLLSRERVAAEFDKLLVGARAAEVLRAYPDIAAIAIPPLTGLMDTPEKAGVQPSEWDQALSVLQRTPKELPLRWAALLMGLGADSARDTLRELRQPNQLSDEVHALIAHRALAVKEALLPRRLAELGYPRLKRLLLLQQAIAQAAGGQEDTEYSELIQSARQVWNTHPCLQLKDLPVSGHDLLHMGYPPGRAVGDALGWLFELVLDAAAPPERETLMKLARERLEQNRTRS